MLTAIFANAPAELHALSTAWHAALHVKAAIQAQIKALQSALAEADLTDAELETVAGGAVPVVIACFVG